MAASCCTSGGDPQWFERALSGVHALFQSLLRGRRAEAAEAEPQFTAWQGKLISDRLDDWRLLPTTPNWAKGFDTHWTPGEAGAQARLKSFIDEKIAGYAEGRDRPDLDLTSRLSPHLHFGEISPAQAGTRCVQRSSRRAASSTRERRSS